MLVALAVLVAATFVLVALVLADGVGGGANTDAAKLTSDSSPEYIASNESCPQDLPQLSVSPVSGQVSGQASGYALQTFVELPDATVIAFHRPRSLQLTEQATENPNAERPNTENPATENPDNSDKALSASSLGGFVGTRNGTVWSFTGLADTGPANTVLAGTAVANTVLAGTAVANTVLSESPLLDLSGDTSTEHDQGLVGMSIGPKEEWLYLNRTAADGRSLLTAHAISYQGVAGTSLGEAIELLSISQPSAQHNGGGIVFDTDGYMYVSFGDGGGLGDPLGNAQDLTTPLGAVLRLQVDPAATDPAARALAAPGNPYLATDDADSNSGGAASDATPDDRIWVSGVRNPYRMAYDSVAQQLWVADVGQQCMEEITVLNLSEGGADLGWNVFEGVRSFVGEASRPHRQPDFAYRHGRGLCSVSGGQLYRGTALTELTGLFVWADLCGGRIYALDPNDASQPPHLVFPVVDLGVMAELILGLVPDPRGELYVIDLAYGVYRLVPASGN